MTTIRRISVSELCCASTIDALLAEYAQESAASELGTITPQFDTYLQLEAAGMLHMLGAYHEDALIGFLCVLLTTLPHFGGKTAVAESFFVARAHRGYGAGTLLLRQAEQLAREQDAKGFMLSAPIGGALDRVMQRSTSYRAASRTYVRAL